MKQTVRIGLIVLSIVMLAAVFAACAKDAYSEAYWYDDTENFQFSEPNHKVKLNTFAEGKSNTLIGTYQISVNEDGSRTITFDFSKSGSLTVYDGVNSYEEGTDERGNYIVLNGIMYRQR